MNTASIGRAGEQRASDYLERIGYAIITRNWKRRSCEIDSIALHNSVLHFVEVKYRLNLDQGDGLDYITPQKIKQMTYAANMWVGLHNWPGEYVLSAVSIDPKGIAYIESIDF